MLSTDAFLHNSTHTIDSPTAISLSPRRSSLSLSHRAAPRLLARRLQETKASPLASLPLSCDRSSDGIDFCCLENNRVVCATQEGTYVLRHATTSRTSSTQQQLQHTRQWDFVRCPINHYGTRHLCSLDNTSSSGFMVGLGSGDYYHIGTDGRASSLISLQRRPRRRYAGQSRQTTALTPQWNSTLRAKNLVELHNWRDGGSLLDVTDWDFYETAGTVLALQAGGDFLGLHDYRIGTLPGNKYQIFFEWGMTDQSSFGSFSKCCFLSEHIVATTSGTLGFPIRLWDLRKTQSSTGRLLSFPLAKSSAPLEPWSPGDLGQSLRTANSFIVQSMQRLDTGGKLLLTCVEPNLIDTHRAHLRCVAMRHLVVDPIQDTINLLSCHTQHADVPQPSCLVSLPHFNKPSLLVHPSNNIRGFDLVDIYGDTPVTTQSHAPTAKRRKPSFPLGLSKMGNMVGSLHTDNVLDEYGLSSHLIQMAWDKKGFRLVGLSQDFDVFEWQS